MHIELWCESLIRSRSPRTYKVKFFQFFFIVLEKFVEVYLRERIVKSKGYKIGKYFLDYLFGLIFKRIEVLLDNILISKWNSCSFGIYIYIYIYGKV